MLNVHPLTPYLCASVPLPLCSFLKSLCLKINPSLTLEFQSPDPCQLIFDINPLILKELVSVVLVSSTVAL